MSVAAVGECRLMKSYAAGASAVDVVVDLLAACGLSVDRHGLHRAMSDALARAGRTDADLVVKRGYNATATPAFDQVQALMKSMDLNWAIHGGEFVIEPHPDAVTVVDGQVTCTEAEFADVVETIVTEQVAALMAGAR